MDGADWALLDQYAERGVMPVLRGLVAEGASGTLQTIHPALSPLIWNTMLTGVMPLEHRVLDFLRVNPVSGQREPITSDERKAPAVWNMATNAGKRVAALGFCATYPAEAVNGLLCVGSTVHLSLQRVRTATRRRQSARRGRARRARH